MCPIHINDPESANTHSFEWVFLTAGHKRFGANCQLNILLISQENGLF